MVPATRSGIDVSFWILERAAHERIAMTLPKLRWLLYLAQAHYAIMREGAKLMPATFVVAEDGPTEPTLDLVFQAGLENPWSPNLSETVLSFLEGFWKRFGALPTVALHKLVLGDPSWKRASEGGPGNEIHVEQHRAAGKPSAHAMPISDALAKPGSRRSPSARSADLPPFEEEVKARIEQYARESSMGRILRGQAPNGPGGKPSTKPNAAEMGGTLAHAAPPDNQEVRFTADGRSVTRWRPKRRVAGPTV